MGKSKMKKLQELCHKIAVEKGFWDTELLNGYYPKHYRNNAEMLMLMVSELGEACEGLRKGDMKNVAEELADCVIRVMDFCEARKIDLEKEILKKTKKNKKRPYKHGKLF